MVFNLCENVKYRYPKLSDFLEEFVSGFRALTKIFHLTDKTVTPYEDLLHLLKIEGDRWPVICLLPIENDFSLRHGMTAPSRRISE